MGRLSRGGGKMSMGQLQWVQIFCEKHQIHKYDLSLHTSIMSATMGRPVETGRKLKANTVQQPVETGRKLKANTVQQHVEMGHKLKPNTVQLPVVTGRKAFR